MPRSNTSGIAKLAKAIVAPDGRELTTAERLRVQADALHRAAIECSHQHDRAARLSCVPAVAAEQRLVRQMRTVADQHLGEMATAYEQAASRFQPETPERWWRRANILWLAAREYQLHHELCDEVSRDIETQDAGMLGELQMEYELAASALLAMRQAADAYRKAREEAP